MLLFEDVVSMVLAALGIYVIYRCVLKAWKWADVKQTEEELERLAQQEKHVKEVQEHNPIDPISVKQKLNAFVKGEKK